MPSSGSSRVARFLLIHGVDASIAPDSHFDYTEEGLTRWSGTILTQSMTYLIAEDEADIRMLIAMMLQMLGHQSMVFESGQKVWDWLDEVEKQGFEGPLPDFVLMDIRMPGHKGNEVARRMRGIPAFARRPIVLMTAFSLSSGERQEMMDADGVDEILAKPLPDFEELHTLLHNIHNRKQTEAAPTDSGNA